MTKAEKTGQKGDMSKTKKVKPTSKDAKNAGQYPDKAETVLDKGKKSQVSPRKAARLAAPKAILPTAKALPTKPERLAPVRSSPGRKKAVGVTDPATRKDAPENAVTEKGALKHRVGKDGNRMPRPLIEQLFAAEYIVDLDGAAAYLRVCPHVTANTARTQGYDLLTRPTVQAMVKKAIDDRVERTGISADRTLRILEAQAYGDRTALTAVHVGCCRYCWGEKFGYQRTDGEYADDLAEHQEKVAMMLALDKPLPPDFNVRGGPGFHAGKMPNPDCPSCAGDGDPKAVLKDTRRMNAEVLAMFDGAKNGKNGVEINITDRQTALTALMRHQGLFEADNKQTAPENVSGEMLEKIKQGMAEAEREYEEMMARRRAMGMGGG